MRHLASLTAGLLVLAATPAWAADAPAKPDDESVKLSPVGLPVVVDGKVINYVFVTVIVDLAPGADVIALREKEPDFRDALVREAHRSPFVLPGDYNHLDQVRLKAVMFRDATAIVGGHLIKAIEIQNEQAQHFIRAPKPVQPASN